MADQISLGGPVQVLQLVNFSSPTNNIKALNDRRSAESEQNHLISHKSTTV